jgi:uncharacterized protein with ParB-like and HNH nuclease domain/predicted transport protein
MKADEIKLLDFLKKSEQFVIPIYQRTYSWTEKECEQLWEDILRTGNDDNITAHFVGSIVYVEKGLFSVASQASLLVIDGQQRLTTINLLLEALARIIGDEEPMEGFSAEKLRNYYLLNHLEDGDKKYKLILSKNDKTSLVNLLTQEDLPTDYSIRVKENFDYFYKKIEAQKDNLKNICKGLAKLVIVDISLNREQDNPQLIFESLNSTGKELSQADLIRNFILMGLEPDLQSRLYTNYWLPMEDGFGQEAYAKYFDSFMRHYLTVKTSEIPKEREIYDAFKLYSRTPEIGGIESLIADVKKFATYYCAIFLESEQDKELKLAFKDLKELKVDVSLPFLLNLYSDYEDGILVKEDFLKTIRLTESYVFRRAICNIPTNSMNKTFATFFKSIKKDDYLESVLANFITLPSYRRFPDDAEFKRELQIRDIYNFRSRSYWLRRLENFNRKERVPVDEFTIEHVLPQNVNLSREWIDELGEDWERIQDTYLHTLGNLTLTGYNSEYSDKPFVDKKNMKGGFIESPIKLNTFIAKQEHWREKEIKERAKLLSELAINVWQVPILDKSIIDKYAPAKEVATTYSIKDHPHLEGGLIEEIFNRLRREILSIDPCISEQFLKLYVAYKAETNFVDIVPQATRLRLSLNLDYPEINDPKGACKDVTNLGRWGNGNVEVGVSKLEDIPYVMGLVRQSFEKQMGNNQPD